MAFEGYTGGGGKDVYEGLLSSGDVGHFDEDGRLFIDGRDDEMIVSGGENVFPREVEDLLAGHDDVKEVAVIGVDDDEFGQRLKAFVVLTTASRSTRTRQGLREGEPRPLQGPARGRVPRLAAAQRDRQGPQARAHLSVRRLGAREIDRSMTPPRGVKKGTKRARQYEHVKKSEKQAGRSEGRAEEIAARTVNKEKARRASRERVAQLDERHVLGRRGGKRSGSGPAGAPASSSTTTRRSSTSRAARR